MRSMITAIAAGAALMFGAATAQAVPATVVAPGVDAAQVIPVAEGCGPGFHRNFRGICVPGGFGRPGYGGGFEGRRCFVRETPFGPRRICR